MQNIILNNYISYLMFTFMSAWEALQNNSSHCFWPSLVTFMSFVLPKTSLLSFKRLFSWIWIEFWFRMNTSISTQTRLLVYMSPECITIWSGLSSILFSFRITFQSEPKANPDSCKQPRSRITILGPVVRKIDKNCFENYKTADLKPPNNKRNLQFINTKI